jgi:hypothetical protein
MPAVYLNGSYSSSSFSHGAGILPGGGGGGAALGISADFLVLGGGCEGKGGGIARGAADGGRGGGADEGDMTGERSSTAFNASLCGAAEAISVS